MDEIVIDDKKYLSSKQAAKATGYAKDYIGQMCREGRVPARLVGRSWYVLESALKDHRFGVEKHKDEKKETPENVYSRYEADDVETIETRESEIVEETNQAQSPMHSIQEAWEAWFDRVAHTAAPVAADESAEEEGVDVAPESVPEEEVSIPTTKEEVIPIHQIRQPVPVPIHIIPRKKKKSFFLFKVLSLLVAIAFVGLAGLNSGYFDDYLISLKRDLFISGITVYKK